MKNTVLTKLVIITTAMALGGFLSGCSWSIGGRKGESYVHPTQGQELIDLKRAKDQGAITAEEYEAKKKRLLEK